MKLNKRDKELIERAFDAVEKGKLLKMKDFGEVGGALITSKGNI